MSDEIIKVLDAICDKLGIAADWTSENVMPYLEIIAENVVKLELAEAVMGIIYAVIFLGIAVGLLCLAKHCFKRYKETDPWDNMWDVGGTISIIGVIVLGIVGVAVLFVNIENVVECLVFPEKVVFDFVTGYIESMK